MNLKALVKINLITRVTIREGFRSTIRLRKYQKPKVLSYLTAQVRQLYSAEIADQVQTIHNHHATCRCQTPDSVEF
jgi:hypothetical protein